MKRERRFEWWGKTMLLGAGSALAVGLGGGMLSPALAQTGSAVSASLTTACPGLEALVSDEVDGPDPWGQGEVIKFATSLSQGTLTNNLSPLGAPNLDSPEDMAFDLNGNVVTADEGITTGVAQVVRVDRNTGVRTLISGAGAGLRPRLERPVLDRGGRHRQHPGAGRQSHDVHLAAAADHARRRPERAVVERGRGRACPWLHRAGPGAERRHLPAGRRPRAVGQPGHRQPHPDLRRRGGRRPGLRPGRERDHRRHRRQPHGAGPELRRHGRADPGQPGHRQPHRGIQQPAADGHDELRHAVRRGPQRLRQQLLRAAHRRDRGARQRDASQRDRYQDAVRHLHRLVTVEQLQRADAAAHPAPRRRRTRRARRTRRRRTVACNRGPSPIQPGPPSWRAGRAASPDRCGNLRWTPRPWPSPPPSAPACRTAPRPATPDR